MARTMRTKNEAILACGYLQLLCAVGVRHAIFGILRCYRGGFALLRRAEPDVAADSCATTRHIAAPVLAVHEDWYYSCQNKPQFPCAPHFAGYGLPGSSSVPS